MPLDEIWISTDIRTRYVVVQRTAGETLDSIGQRFAISREGVRLIEKSFWTSIRKQVEEIDVLLEKKGKAFLASRRELSDLLKVSNGDLLNAICHEFKLRKVRAKATTYFVRGAPIWVSQVKDNLPMTERELGAMLSDQSFGDKLGVAEDLAEAIWIEGLGLVRKSGALRDEIFLRLITSGVPLREEDLAQQTGVSIRNLRAHIDRDDRFVRNFALNLVSLSVWKIDDFAIKTAQDSLVRVLQESGPLAQNELIKRAIAIFPRTHSRYIQALEDPVFGRTKEGEIGLVSLGAMPVLDHEPKRHQSIREHTSTRVSTEIQVTHDVMRGAGVPVHKRLGWVVGLRKSGDSRQFELDGFTLTVRRQPGAVALSSMRGMVQAMQLHVGCKVEIAFDTEEGIFGVRSVCPCHWLQKPPSHPGP